MGQTGKRLSCGDNLPDLHENLLDIPCGFPGEQGSLVRSYGTGGADSGSQVTLAGGNRLQSAERISLASGLDGTETEIADDSQCHQDQYRDSKFAHNFIPPPTVFNPEEVKR